MNISILDYLSTQIYTLNITFIKDIYDQIKWSITGIKISDQVVGRSWAIFRKQWLTS